MIKRDIGDNNCRCVLDGGDSRVCIMHYKAALGKYYVTL